MGLSQTMGFDRSADLGGRSIHVSQYAATGLLVVLLFGVHTFIYRTPSFPLDDAYITLHNATILAGAKEINYAGVPALAGTTSVVHTVLVAALTLLLPPTWALMVMSWIGILLYTLAVTYLASVHRLPKWATASLLLVAMFAGRAIFQLLNGLETGLAMASLVFALALASRNQPSRHLAVLCGILPFLRPELIVISALLLANQERLRWRSAAKPREIVLDVISACAAGLIWLIVLFADTGYCYPASINAKRFFFAESSLPATYKVLAVDGAIRMFAVTIGVPLAACAAFAFSTAAGRLALLFGGAFLATYFAQFPGALWHNDQRYLYLLMPIILLGVAAGLSASNHVLRKGAIFLLAVSALQTVLMLPTHLKHYETGLRMATIESASVASFCNQHFSPHSRILLHDAGYLSYATRFPLIDLVGLKTPSSIPIHRQITYPTGGRGRAAAVNEIAYRSNPDYLVVISDWERIFGIAAGLRANGWVVEPVRANPPPDGLNHYLIFQIWRK